MRFWRVYLLLCKMLTPEAAASQGCEPAAAQSADKDVDTYIRRLFTRTRIVAVPSVDRTSTPEAAASPASVLAVIIHFRGLCPLAELKLRFTPTSFLQCKKEAKKTFAASPLSNFLFSFFTAAFRFSFFANQLIFIKKSVIIIKYTKTVRLNQKDKAVSEDI